MSHNLRKFCETLDAIIELWPGVNGEFGGHRTRDEIQHLKKSIPLLVQNTRVLKSLLTNNEVQQAVESLTDWEIELARLNLALETPWRKAMMYREEKAYRNQTYAFMHLRKISTLIRSSQAARFFSDPIIKFRLELIDRLKVDVSGLQVVFDDISYSVMPDVVTLFGELLAKAPANVVLAQLGIDRFSRLKIPSGLKKLVEKDGTHGVRITLSSV